MGRPSVLQENRPRLGAATLLALAGTLICAATADARGGGAAPPSHGAAPRLPAPPAARPVWQKPLAPQGRIATRGRRAYYPAGAWGYGGFVAGAETVAPAFAEPSTRADFLYSQSVIIHRGPAFGEPGYYAHPSIYRIIPEPSKRAGVRRYRVERMDF